MGFGGISIWQLLIILVIVLLLFGTKRLRNIGSDLGNAVKGFKNSMTEGEAAEAAKIEKKDGEGEGEQKGEVIEAEVVKEEKKDSA